MLYRHVLNRQAASGTEARPRRERRGRVWALAATGAILVAVVLGVHQLALVRGPGPGAPASSPAPAAAPGMGTHPAAIVPPAPAPAAAPADTAARAAAQRQAAALAGAPITLNVQDSPATLTLAPRDLQTAVAFTADGQGAPTAAFDPRRLAALLAPLAAQVRVVPRDATIQLVNGRPVVVPEVSGWALDLPAAAQAVSAAAGTAARTATVALQPDPAAVTTATLAPLTAQWTGLLVHGFTFRHGPHAWVVRGATLAGQISVAPGTGGPAAPAVLAIAPAVLATRLTAIAPAVAVSPRNARFRLVNGVVTTVAAARPGQQLDQAATLAAAAAALAAGQRQADLVVAVQPAPDAGALPLVVSTPDLLAQSSTTYYGSSPERAHNVELGTSLVNGALVPPGAEFSLDNTLGPLTLAAGFQMGFGIVSDGTNVTTVPAEGGGICQVATTLFHSVFWSGLPITERHHHSYWIALYGQRPSGLQGLDATISPPEEDLRWRNTTGNWILIRAHAGGGVVRLELWGTNPGWTVDVDGPVITQGVPTDRTPIYEPSMAVAWGVTRQVEHAQSGFTADIHRRVYAATGTLLDDWHAQGTYLPSHNRYLVGQRGRPAPPPAPTATPPPLVPAPGSPSGWAPAPVPPPLVPTPGSPPPAHP